jgi:catechol 2,3-dioxygenase-like lactoylglutathione lyase family enzyme
MDVLHPRLLVSDFAPCFAFYDAFLPRVLGATLAKGGPEGPYAHWDVGSEGVLSMFDREAMAEVVGELSASAQDRVMFVSRVSDVDRAYAVCLAHGGRSVTEPTDRPDWGLRAAHVRDPEGNLVELQSY